MHKAVGLVGKANPQQRVQSKGRIPNPGIAVIPVPFPAQLLRQATGGRRHNRPGRFVGQQLQHQRRALHHLPPAPLVGTLLQPPPPVGHRLLKQRVPLRLRARMIIRPVVPQYPDGHRDRLPLGQRKRAHHAVIMLLQQHAGGKLQPQAFGDKRRPVVVNFCAVRIPRVIKRRVTFQDKRHYPPHAVHPADQLRMVMRMPVGGNRHKVNDLRHPAGRQKAGHQHIRRRPIHLPMHRRVIQQRRNLEKTALPVVQNAGKNAGRIKTRAAKPVHRTIDANQRASPHIADDAVILNRQVCHSVTR